MFKRVLSLLLIVLLIFSFTAGCGTSGDTAVNNEKEMDEVETSSEEGAPDEETPEEEEPVVEETYDFGGRVIRGMAWWDMNPVEGSSETADNQIARKAELEQKYNMKLEFINTPWMEYLEKITASVLAGDPCADYAFLEYYWFWPTLVANGFLQNLDDLNVFDFNEDKWNQTLLKIGTYNGKRYGFNVGRQEPRGVLFWNKEIFEREGVPSLYELQRSKQWNWDKLLEISLKLTKDLDGDGIIDQYAIGGHDLEWYFFFSNGALDLYQNEDGVWTIGLNDPRGIKGFQFAQDLINQHRVVIPPEGGGWDWQWYQNAFIDGRIAMVAADMWLGDNLKDMEADYGIVMFPMGPDAEKYYSKASSPTMFAMLAGNKKPEEAAMVIDDWTDPFPGEASPEEEWLVFYEGRVRDRESLEMLTPIRDDGDVTRVNRWNAINELANLQYGFISAIRNNAKTPQVAIEEILPQAQAIVDELLNGR